MQADCVDVGRSAEGTATVWLRSSGGAVSPRHCGGVWYRGESARSPRLYPGAEARRGGVCHPPLMYVALFVVLFADLFVVPDLLVTLRV
jgi:hypothetical protein